MSRQIRVYNELKTAMADNSSFVTLKLLNEADLSHLTGTFQGPPGTPYHGGEFLVDIVLPPEYPFKPPKMKFITKIYHPNISSQTGAICLDILKDKWTPILTLQSCLISLQSLLQSPEPNDPQDAQVASQFLNDRKGFDDTAKYWTEVYARPSEKGSESQKPDADSGSSLPESSSSSTGNGNEDPYFGIDPKLVQHFTDMGFPEDKVLNVLRINNIRKFEPDAQKRSQQEGRVLEKLLV